MLDFSGHSVEDSFLLATLPAFSKLRLLSLNTSRKLSHHFVLALLGQSGASLHLSAHGPKTCSHAVMAGITLQATVSHIATHSFVGQSRAWSLATFGHFVICVSTSSYLQPYTA